MGLIYSQDFDGPTAPSLPSGFNQTGSTWATATAENSITPTSPSNMARLATSSNTPAYLVYNTPDGNSGDVTIYCNLNAFSAVRPGTVGLVARGSAATLDGTTNQYACWLDWNNGTLKFSRWNAGTETVVGSLSLVGGWTQWDTFIWSLNGSTLSVQVQRSSDNEWLTVGGSWQVTRTTALSVTDPSPIAGSGYFGLAGHAGASSSYDGYWDDLAVYTYGSGPGDVPPAGLAAWNPARRKPRTRWVASSGNAVPVPPGSPLVGAIRPTASPRRPHAGRVRIATPRGATPTPVAIAATIRPTSRPPSIAPRSGHARVVLDPGPFSAGPTVFDLPRRGLFVHADPSKPAPRRGGVARAGIPTPAAPAVAAGAPVATVRPAARRERPPRRGAVMIGAWLTPPPPPTLTPPGPGVARPTSRRELPPHRGLVVLSPRQTLGSTTDHPAFYVGIIRPVARSRPSPRPRGRTNVGRWTSQSATPVQPPPLLAITGSVVRPHRRRERHPRPSGFLYLTGRQRITIGPGLYYNIYADHGTGDPIDYTTAVATTTATSWISGVLAVPGTWKFGVRAADQWGEEQNVDCVVSIVFDASGVDVSNRPAAPTGLRAFPSGANAIRAEWYYPPISGPRAPAGFNVYISFAPTLIYGTPAVVVPYSSGLFNAYFADLPVPLGGRSYVVGVRAFNSSGAESNTNTVTCVASGSGPQAVVGLIATATT